MRYASSHPIVPLAVIFIALPLLAFQQEPPPPKEQPPAEKQTPKDQAPTPRLDLYGDPLPEGAIRRMGTARFRHLGSILSLAYSPDGKILASGGHAGTLRLWDAETGRTLARLEGEGAFTSVAFSPDGRSLAGGQGRRFCTPGPVHLWDVTTGERIRTLHHFMEAVNSIAFTPDGTTLAVGTGGETGAGQVHVWDLETGNRLHSLSEHTLGVTSIALSPDGRTLASGSHDKTIILWDARSWKKRRTLKMVPGNNAVFALAYSPDGRTLASGHRDRTIRLWDEADGEELRTLEKCHRSSVWSVAFSPDGKTLASSSSDLTVCLWEVSTGNRLRRFARPWERRRSRRYMLSPVAFSPDGKTLASGGQDPKVRLWNLETGQERSRFGGHEGFVCSVTFSPEGDTLVTGGNDDTLRLWDVATCREKWKYTGHKSIVSSVAFSPDGETIASGSDDETVRLWDTDSRKQLELWKVGDREGRKVPGQKFTIHRVRPVTNVEFTGDGQYLLAGCLDQSVFLFQLRPPTTRVIAKPREMPLGSRLRVVGAGKRPKRFLTTPFYSEFDKTAVITPDGRSAIFIYGGSIQICDITTGKITLSIGTEPQEGSGPFLLADSEIRCLSLSQDGRMVATAGTAGRVHIIEMATGSLVRGWSAHEDQICALAFAPDGRLLASAAEDGKIRLWDPTRGKQLAQFHAGEGWAVCVAFSPDGGTLASGGLDTTVLLWDLEEVRDRLPLWTRRPRPNEMDALWDCLADKDAGKAYGAIRMLARAPDLTVTYFNQRLKAAEKADSELIWRLLSDLEHDEFAVRENGEEAIRALGRCAESALRDALERGLSPEAHARVRALLDGLPPPFTKFPSEALRSLRAIQVLESMGTGRARTLLRTLAAGSPYALQTREAKAALERLEGLGEGKR